MKIKKRCIICNKDFEVIESRIDAKYCSKKCYFSDMSRIAKENGFGKWMIGKKATEETKIKMKENSYWKGKKRPEFTEEHKRKIAESNLGLKGEKSKRWIKDRTKLMKRDERNDSAYQNWAKEVKKRDNYQCKICGIKDNLISHHILPWKDFPEERYNINNGITLCQTHHPKTREDEKILIPALKELVEVI